MPEKDENESFIAYPQYSGEFSTPTIPSIEIDMLEDLQKIYDAYVDTPDDEVSRYKILQEARQIKYYQSQIIGLEWNDHRIVCVIFMHGFSTVRREII